ncbi:MAG TPA: branched-chain amino acid ABC transporter permease [Acidimicrobiaceae bacterium]|jgi:neutral amino acid transport system permease protein|nr:branched-chain amino acid ABC transporter permease [Acidimicrobiaceae bacterium]
MRLRLSQVSSRMLLILGVLIAAVLVAPGASAQEGEGIQGTFINRDDGKKPVPGVVVVVSDASGTKVGTATSDADGSYSLDLPKPGKYVAELQIKSLPTGVKLTDTSKTKLSFQVNPGQRKPLIFPFGKDTATGVSIWAKLPGTLLDGVRLGLIIAMTAIGLSLIYGTTQFTNFAHGEQVTFGALATWYLNQEAGLSVIPAALIAIVLSGALGLGLDAGLWTPLRRRKTSPFALMVVSFGLSIALQAVFQFFYGTRTKPFSEYGIQEPLFKLGNQNVPPRAVVMIIISVVVLGSVGLFLQRARFGKAMRAVADNGPLASSSGINTDRVVRLVWMMGAALAGLGGILYSLDNQVSFGQGQSLLLLMFAGITLGGLGTSFGAAAGCFILGVAIQLSTLFIPTSLKSVGALVILIVVLMFRPQGVFGRKERVG